MAESFAVSGIEATEADLSHAGMPPYPTPFAAEIEYPLPRSGALSQLFKG